MNALPRTHTTTCHPSEVTEVKSRLLRAGFHCYDPIYSRNMATITYLRLEDVNRLALNTIGPGDDSE